MNTITQTILQGPQVQRYLRYCAAIMVLDELNIGTSEVDETVADLWFALSDAQQDAINAMPNLYQHLQAFFSLPIPIPMADIVASNKLPGPPIDVVSPGLVPQTTASQPFPLKED